MKKIFTLLCFIAYLNVYAKTNLVQIYRHEGLASVQKHLQSLLQDPLYWQDYLQNKDVSIGFYEFDIPVIIVNKKVKNIKLYKQEGYKQNLLYTQEVIVGKMGDKQKEGDLKTPVGTYDIQKRFIPQDQFYGPLAFALTYPNNLDILQNKDGHGIWIHGYPLNNDARADMTKGCIALKNDELKKFDKLLNTTQAIVIITEDDKIAVSKQDMSAILSQLFAWQDAWRRSDINAYLSFYDDRFIRYDGKNKEEFTSFKRAIFQKKESKIIRFKNIAISPYPNNIESNLYRISFDEIYKTQNYNFTGKKELYIKLEDDKMKILTEK